jgi:exopolysaccharide biosynthesis polyprenyl glycosylphosphotransferase
MRYPRYKIVLAFFDFVLVRLSLSAALQVRGVSFVHGDRWSAYVWSPEFYFFFLYSLFVLLIFKYHNLYKINIALSRASQLTALVFSSIYSVLGIAVLSYFIRSAWIIDSRLAVIYFGLFSVVSIGGYRLFIFKPLYAFLSRKRLIRRRLALVGASVAAKNLAIQMFVENVYGLQLAGFIDNNYVAGERVFEQYTNLGRFSDIPEIVERDGIDELVITVADVEPEELFGIIDLCKKTRAEVKVASTLFEIVHKKNPTESYYDVPLARMRERSNGVLVFKRIFDLCASATGLIILALPFLVIAVVIKVTSRGPVLHRQVRLGMNGKPFILYKFRSMRQGSESAGDRARKMRDFIRNGPNRGYEGTTKIVDEESITPFGRLIRKTSIDELPQLFNVLKGDMSLVGPRPCLPYELEAYAEWHKRRLSAKPGCTGLWQVSSRSFSGFDDMVILDLYYVDNQSAWLDLVLILKTIPVMVFARGGK